MKGRTSYFSRAVRCLLISAVAIATMQPAGAQSGAGKGANAALYAQHCAGCHGEKLTGGLGVSLIDEKWSYGGGDTEIAASIAQGRGVMPPFAGVLSDRDVRSLVFYIREMRTLAEKAGLAKAPDPETTIFESKLHRFRLQKVAEADTDLLWSVNFLPDGRIVAPEKSGRLWLIEPGGKKTLITGTPKVLESYDGGLFEVVPHPDYAKNGWLYMAYASGRRLGESSTALGVIPNVRGNTRLVRGRIRDGVWVDQETIFESRADDAELLGMRFGCRIVFRDGYVFFSIGDGGQNDSVQRLSTPAGKVFRLHDDGRVPEDNPFVGIERAYPQIWTYGNRNVQGLAFHPETGALYATEHGPRGGDEINILRQGANYGWPVVTFGIDYDGKVISDMTDAPGMVQPIHYWVPSIGPGGIDFYTGTILPKWRGALFVSAMSGQQLRRIVIKNEKVIEDEVVLRGLGRVRDVVTGADGRLYVIVETRSPNTGRIYRLVPAEDQAPCGKRPCRTPEQR